MSNIIKMEEDTFRSRAQRDRPIKIIRKAWENGSYMIYFEYVKREVK